MMEMENTEIKYCRLTFESCYDFYKLIDCLSKFLDDGEIDISENKMQIRAIDPSRICLLNIKKDLYDNEVNQDIKVGLNFEDLAKILKCAKKDKKELTIDFDIEQITNYKIRKYPNESITKKVLKTLALDEIEDVPMENLMNIVYPNYVKIEKTYLMDFFSESVTKSGIGIFSEVVEIKMNDKGIYFSESGLKGNSEFFVDRSNLVDSKSFDTEIGNYSLAYLNNIKTLLIILENSDTIKISLKKDHPLKIEIYLTELDIQLSMFLAPRVKEASDFDEKDNWIEN